MALKVDSPVPVTFLLWDPNNQTRKETRRFQHAALVNHRRRRAERPKQQTHAADTKTAAQSRHNAGKRLAGQNQPVASPARDLSVCFDPFNTLSLDLVPANGQAVLQFASVHQWPCFAFSSHKSAVAKWLSNTMSLAIGNTHLISALIYAGTTYQLFLGCKEVFLPQLRAASYQESLADLRETITHRDASEPVSDSVLLTIAVLTLLGAAHRPVKIAKSTDPMYRDNEFYTRNTWETAHVNALLLLTKQRGGPKTIAAHDLAEIIIGIDTHDAMCFLRKPFFPPLISTNKLLHCFRGYWDATTRKMFPTSGVNVFHFLPNTKQVKALSDVVSKARALFATYEIMLNHPERGIDIVRWVITRRAIQNDAMTVDGTGSCLFKLCRLAVQMFMAESIEAMLELCPYHENSARALMLIIDECSQFNYWERHAEILLWATLIGGFTARKRPLRWWYAEQLRNSPIPTVKDHWEQVQQLSEKLLPFRYEQGKGIQQFWDESCEWLAESVGGEGLRTFRTTFRPRQED